MSKEPLVSIITPCYNGEKFLKRYFESIISQTYSNIELIFVNDGSKDKTEEIVFSYRNELEARGIKFIYIFQENAGQAAALNRGLKVFTGEYLTWPDSDDEMTPDCIEKKVQYLIVHPEIEMVRSDGIFFNEDTKERKRIACDKDKCIQDIFEELLLVHTYGCCGCYMITKSLFMKSYPDRDIFESKVGQNWQLLVPAASRTLCGYIDDVLYIVHERKESHSRSEHDVEEKYQRWDRFTDVVVRAIAASECDKSKYICKVLENKGRQQFYYAVSIKDKKKMQKCINLMKKNGKVTMKEYLLYLRKMFF